MIISRAEIRSAVAAYTSRRRKASLAPRSLETPHSRFRAEAAEVLGILSREATQEVFYRADVVAMLHRSIAEGRYFVPTEDIVDKLLGRLIVEVATA